MTIFGASTKGSGSYWRLRLIVLLLRVQFGLVHWLCLLTAVMNAD